MVAAPTLSPLRRVLQIKIVVTLLLWGPPLLVAPDSLIAWMGFPPLEPALFRRLLGAAYIALVIGYGNGLAEIAAARYPSGTVAMGIVSNGLAAVLLWGSLLIGEAQSWANLAPTYIAVSAIATTALTAALAACHWRWIGAPR
ncbi:MAG: hypothetical protein AAFX44_17870 [Pseudomonadota bacterium]